MDELTDLDIQPDNEFASESFLDSLEENRSDEEIPDICHREEQNEDEGENDLRWSISLSEVPNDVRISEFGHTYIYGRLKDPEGLTTNKFHGFFRNSNSDWKSLPGILSDRYTIVSLEKFINNIIKQKFRNITENVVYNGESWKLAWVGVVNDPTYIIEYIDNSVLKFIFKNIHNENLSVRSAISKLGLIITNTYNGTNKLKFNPIVKTSIIKDDTSFDFIDYFTFSNFTQVISHSSTHQDINNDLIVIKENIGEHVSMLTNFAETDSIIRNICNCFRKPNRTIFESILKEIATYNLFNILIIASIVLYKKYSIIEHLAIRSKIETFLEREVF